jgi:hypothetical protein
MKVEASIAGAKSDANYDSVSKTHTDLGEKPTALILLAIELAALPIAEYILE